MGAKTAKPEHKVAFADVVALMNKHADKITALELLAIAANAVGKMVALQDQRTVTPEQAMKLVADNIEMGNQEAIAALLRSEGRS